jgi:hypothetical protein
MKRAKGGASYKCMGNSVLTHSLKIHFNIVIPCMSMPSKWYLQFRLPNQNSVRIPHCSFSCYMFRPSHSLFI